MAITGEDIIDVSLQIAVAVLYSVVAVTISNRVVSQKSRQANVAFSSWWWGLAALTGFGVLRTIKVWFIEPSMPAYMAYLYFILLVIMMAFTGLLYYFLYLWSGKEKLWVPIALFYLALFVFFVYYIELQEPMGFDADGNLEYANDLAGTMFANLVSILWLLPPIIGAAAYMTLLRKVDAPILRFRIGMVAGSIIVWFLISIGSSLALAGETVTWWTYVSRLIAVLVATLTLIAYRPPKRVRRWFNLDSDDEMDEADSDEPDVGDDPPVLPPLLEVPR